MINKKEQGKKIFAIARNKKEKISYKLVAYIEIHGI